MCQQNGLSDPVQGFSLGQITLSPMTKTFEDAFLIICHGVNDDGHAGIATAKFVDAVHPVTEWQHQVQQKYLRGFG